MFCREGRYVVQETKSAVEVIIGLKVQFNQVQPAAYPSQLETQQMRTVLFLISEPQVLQTHQHESLCVLYVAETVGDIQTNNIFLQ